MTDRGRTKVGIVDYGVGNLGSLRGALRRLGYQAVVARDAETLMDTAALILPGVGSAPYAMRELRASGLDQFIRDRFEAADKPVIGICLGMQILFEHSEEGDTQCLGLIPGIVRAFPDRACHVGWNIARPTPMAGHDSVRAYYFNHSYFVTAEPDNIATEAHYLGDIPAQVKDGNFTGVQFHPEKSQLSGEALLRDLIQGSDHA